MKKLTTLIITFVVLYIWGCSKIIKPPSREGKIGTEPPGQVFLTQFNTMQLLGDFNGWAIGDLEGTRMTLIDDWTWVKTVYFSAPRSSIWFKFVPDQNWDLAFGTPGDDNGALEGYAEPNQGGTGNHIDSQIPEAGYWTFEFHENNGYYRIYRAGGPPGGISGTVVFTNDSVPPYPQATVYLYNPDWNEVAFKTSDTLTGEYTFTGLDPGTYNIVASATGYQPDTLENIEVQDQVVSVDPLILEPVGGAVVNIVIDGVISPDEDWTLLDSSIVSAPDGANLQYFYAAADAQYLYLAIKTQNTANWGVAYGFGLDLAEGGFASQAGQDAWERLINFTDNIAVEYELYLHWNDGTQTVDAVNLCKYSDNGWTYDANWIEGEDYAFTGSDTQGLEVMEFRIPWDRLNGLPSGIIKGLAWIAGNDPGSSAVDVIPFNTAIQDSQDEWTDLDTFDSALNLPTP